MTQLLPPLKMEEKRGKKKNQKTWGWGRGLVRKKVKETKTKRIISKQKESIIGFAPK